MNIQLLGGARTVTGSMHLLTVNNQRLLVDCGLYQGRRATAFQRNRELPVDPKSLGAMILTHAHIDHSGNIPTLVRAGFDGNIYTTSATRDLCSAMLADSGHIQVSDIEFVNKKRAKKGEPPLEPLYTVEDAVRSLRSFVSLDYDRPFGPVPGVAASLVDAGHILGSAIAVLEVEESGRKVRIAFSGDLGRKGNPIIRDPSPVTDIDYLVLESTYGDRIHEPREQSDRQLQQIVEQAYRRGGKVIIPAFSVGRTQEVVYALHKLSLGRDLPDIPIYVDSPLSVNATEIYRLHPECYDSEVAEFLRTSNETDPFGFHRLTYVRTTEDSKALNFLREPAIIISASGMAEGGRVLHHLRNNIQDARNTILFVGFQAQDTLGRKLVDGWPKVSIFGEEFEVRAQIARLDGYSAHADQVGLTEFARQANGPRLRGVLLVHGEEQASEALRSVLVSAGILNVTVPELGQQIEL